MKKKNQNVELKKLTLNKEKVIALTQTQAQIIIGGKLPAKKNPQSEQVCDSYYECTHDVTLK